MLRQLVRVGAILVFFLALMMAPAFAQNSGPSIELNPQKPVTQEQIEKRRATDEAYDAAMKKIPNKKSSSDPWGDIRPATPTTVKNKQQQ